MESSQHNLVYEEELVEEAEEALQRKHSKNNGNGKVNVVYCCGNNSHEAETKENGDDFDFATEENGESLTLPNNNNNSVYFDQNDGKPINGVLEMKNDNVTSTTFETNSRVAHDHLQNVEIKKSLIEEINDQCEEIFGDRGFTNSSLSSLEESHGEQKLKSESFNSETRLVGDLDIRKEVDQEEAELDFERLIQKQNTHDLYCPNCNSCITRRVILRRRKPKIRNAHRKPKHNKPVRTFSSELDANNANSTDNEVHGTVNIHSSVNEALMAHDHNSNREPEVFRCLSCFSFFIPTGDGFKLFRLFGDSNDNENVQNLQETPATNKNWFSSIFASDKKKMTIEQAGNETLADQNGLISSISSPSAGLVNDFGSASPVARKEFVNSSTEDSKYLENTSTGVGEKSDNATEKVNTGTMLYQDKQCHSATPLPGILINKREPAEDARLGPMQVGENSSVSSICESLVPDLSQIDMNSKTAMEKEVVQNDQASSTLGTPLPTKLFGEEGLNGSTVVCHETRKDMFSSSQGNPILGTLKTGVGEIAIDTVEKNTGRDVIVSVETRLVESATSQRAHNIEGSTEAMSLLQSGTQTNTGEQRGAGISVDILKSIVYGGLIESITSLGVVSSAAGAGSATMNIFALGLANLIGGLLIVGHNLIELKNNHSCLSSQLDEHEDRYQLTLGRRQNFSLHATVSILSFLLFGMLPPVIYGFSFYKSDNKDLKLAVIGSVSLVCIILLAIGKAHVQRQPKSYISTVLYYVSIGFMASGVSYIVGDLISKLVEKIGLLEPSLAVTVTVPERRPFDLGMASS